MINYKLMTMSVLDFRRTVNLAAAAGVVLLIMFLAACGEDEPKVDPVTVQFTSTAQTITEDGGAKNITLSLSSAAKKNGTITLSATPANANTFATYPSEITITKGSTSAQFAITPINNAIIDANAKVITFSLDNASSGFELGDQATHAVTITDDEGPTTANFTVASGNVSEGAGAGIAVEITLSPAAEVAGTIEVTMTPPGVVTTTPTATAGGVITVPVGVGQTSVSFNVTPDDNELDDEDLEIDFEITAVTGGVNIGTNVTYTLTVDDDDDIVPTNIADVRALYTGSDVTINTDIYIEGVVISSGNNVTNRNIFIQDATAPVVVRFTAAHTYAQGEKLLINLNGVLLTRDAGSGNTGPLQLGGSAGLDATTKVTATGTGTVPAAETKTVAEVNGGTVEGKLVKVENVFFPEADGILKLSGSRTLSNGTESTIVRSESYSPWQGNAIPLGAGTIEGIVSIFNGTVQLIPLEASDIFANNPVGTIGTTGTLNDFGSVNNGAESAEQSYTVQGTTLTHDIVVTASSGYQVSFTSGTSFGSSVTILAANANAATTVFVKFAPETGINQVVAGTLTHKSQGAASVIVNVTGTETGNSASSRLLTENFEYGTTAGNLLAVAGGNWTVTSGTGSILYSSSSLSMIDYPGSGDGGSLAIPSPIGGEDLARSFTEQTNGSVYTSFLVSIPSAAAATGTYFVHLKDGTTTNFVARVYAQDAGGGKFKFGFGKATGSTAGVYANDLFDYGVTYLVVIKQTLDENLTNANDASALYVLTAVTGTEPGAPLLSDATGTDRAISSVGVRQSTGTPAGTVIDGLRVATVWADLFN